MYWPEAIQKAAEVTGTGWTILPWPVGLDGPYDDVVKLLKRSAGPVIVTDRNVLAGSHPEGSRGDRHWLDCRAMACWAGRTIR